MSALINNINIDRYILRIIRKHLVYVVALVCFITLLVSFIPFQIKQYITLKNNLALLNDEVRHLEEKQSAIRTYSSLNIDQLLGTTNRLLPQVEDKFSIFDAIDSLQLTSGVFIEKFSSPFAVSNPEVVTISVLARVPEQQLKEFLNVYPYRTGRLMGIDKISYLPDSDSLNFTASFYSRNIQIRPEAPINIDNDIIAYISKIQRDMVGTGVSVVRATDDDKAIQTNYQSKQNPFQ